ncbi:MAG: tRNA preQ1(34) S-adenosylmethionine ribosyltransferase-isomerase QueA [Gammaproteobacteria bacterium]
MRRDDFTFELPERLIARRPPEERRDSRLLALPCEGAPANREFRELTELVNSGDLLVFNNSKVIPARVFGTKESGGKIEVLLERIRDDQSVLVKIKASKSPKPGTVLQLAAGNRFEEVVVQGREHDLFVITFSSDPLSYFLNYGEMPLPPYIERRADDKDESRYQTVYAEPLGSVAAPTAGLHFDEAMLNELDAAGVERGTVTLHVGSGTYQPVRADRLEDHVMHSEYIEVSEELVAQVRRVKAAGGKVVCVGTTSLRSLEAASGSGELEAFSGETDIFIYPGYQFRTVDRLLTNFHLPESSLIMLVSALAGRQRILDAYQFAVANNYRFFSYGDCMLIDRCELAESSQYETPRNEGRKNEV